METTAGQLAAELGLACLGDGHQPIRGAASLEDANRDQLAFVGGPKYFAVGRASRSGTVIAPADYEPADGQTVLPSPQPRAHFARALGVLFPPVVALPGIHPAAFVDPAADVDPSAEIGPGVRIGPGSRIGARTRVLHGASVGGGVVVGEDCLVHSGAVLYDHISIGSRCVLHAGCVIGADGFGFEFANGRFHKVPQVGTVEIGSDVEIGANSCVDRAALGVTVIGDGTKLDNMVHIAHNCRIGKHVVIAAQTALAGGVTIGDYAIIGGQVGVGDKARIESRAVVGSGAGILTSKIVRAGEPVWGTPARPLRQYLAQLATLARLAKRRSGA
jgi:UDP-3-O-[3-hydroxymyristoyl] glucosamine N-acyltransferase